MGRLLGALLCFAALGTPLVSALKRAPQKALRALKRELGDAVVIVDGDNVRGKADFRWSKAALYDAVGRWTSHDGRFGRTILFYDHGSEQASYVSGADGMSVCFSGPSDKADDVIAQGVGMLTRDLETSVYLVTSDAGLASRCVRNALSRAQLKVVRSEHFISQLIKEGCSMPLYQAKNRTSEITDVATKRTAAAEGIISLKKAVHKQMRRKTGAKNRAKLRKRLALLDEALQIALSDAHDPERCADGLLFLDSSDRFQTVLSLRRLNRGRKESTADREINAEEFRRDLLARDGVQRAGAEDSAVHAFGRWVNEGGYCRGRR